MHCSKLVRGRRLGRRSLLFTAGPVALASLRFEPVTSFIRLDVASPELAVRGYTAKRAELDQYTGRHALPSLELQNIFGWSGENTREEQISSQRWLPIELKRHFSRPLRDPSISLAPQGSTRILLKSKKFVNRIAQILLPQFAICTFFLALVVLRPAGRRREARLPTVCISDCASNLRRCNACCISDTDSAS